MNAVQLEPVTCPHGSFNTHVGTPRVLTNMPNSLWDYDPVFRESDVLVNQLDLDNPARSVLKIVAHSKTVLDIATPMGWLPGARYTNLRDVRSRPDLAFLDINWKRYDFPRHLEAAKISRPLITVARDVEERAQLGAILDQAYQLQEFAEHVLIVPKDPELGPILEQEIPAEFLLGFSVPTKYGGTPIDPRHFKRATHLLGGRPEVQRRLAELLPVFSLDCNRFTLDAGFGDYFDGTYFKPHPVGGYANCIRDSIVNISKLWETYEAAGRDRDSSRPSNRSSPNA